MADWLFILEIILGVVATVIIIGIAVITFTTGWKKHGRIMGGLWVIVGKPGSGKTYVATHYALEYMRDGRRVFSNYPIVSVDGSNSSRFLEEDKVLKENMNRSVIIRDEAQKVHWSRNYKQFSEEDRNFFSETGHHEISCYEITQHEMRIDTVIRDCANFYLEVDKFEIPFLGMPLFFTVTTWTSAEEMHNALYHPEIEPYDFERIWFNKDVANAYDTRFFGHDKRLPYEGKTWIQHYKEKVDEDHPDGYIWTPPDDISVAYKIRRSYTRQIVSLKKRGYIPSLKPLNRVQIEFRIQVMRVSSVVTEKLAPYFRFMTPTMTFVYWSVRCVWYLNPHIRKVRMAVRQVLKDV